ncbi:probable G-protein coupled receptor No18 [Tetranychus urticae]|uniref:G-protein coupled receptors family 1 profile domain-containing protein n=1 Tax=Tetranychus urticae TaxID=32264 RepID=T1KX89_TETUR|nr:probable G-protein coupled receptor No18 [Tetranychus urticae]
MDEDDLNLTASDWNDVAVSSTEPNIESPKTLLMIVSLTAVTIFTIVGNTMVIISIFSYRPLKNVQNMFLVSLASADIAVAVIVMPFSIVDMLLDRWIFGTFLCEMWLTSDVLLCTASILNLCAIALDRYWAIYDPINYAQRRTVRAVLCKIAAIWIISGVISIPPIFGWNDWPDSFDGDTPCKYSEHIGYVIYSASGSFYVPLVIMSVVYYKIYKATRKRLRERANVPNQSIGLHSTTTGTTSLSMSGAVSASVVNSTNITLNDSTNNRINNIVSNNNRTNRCDNTVGCGTNESSSQSSSPILQGSRHDHNLPSITDKYIVMDDSSRTESATGDTINESIKSSKSTSRSASKKHGTSKSGGQPNTVAKFWEEKQRISLSKERRAARILGVVMGVFTICWLPFFIMYLVIPFYPYVSFEVRAFITWLGYFNSALNPVIYTIFNVDFRRAFARQLRCSTRSD